MWEGEEGERGCGVEAWRLSYRNDTPVIVKGVGVCRQIPIGGDKPRRLYATRKNKKYFLRERPLATYANRQKNKRSQRQNSDSC